jgi:alpha-beta hydrolase superfamily lysophospholipase
MNHFPERKLRPDDKKDQTWVVWARHPVQKTVVFVHGYMGDAISTWTLFESLLPRRPKAKDYDLFFYGYNCYSGNTTAQGRLLCDFLHRLFTSPADLARGSLPWAAGRTLPSDYKEVFLVGHSIGAIVCRRALLMARDLGYSWMPQTKMVLFAPAHDGALVSELLKDLGWSWLKLFISGWRFASPLVDEVAPGSTSITQLKQETIAAVQQGATYLKSTKVVIAEVERVVSNLQFKPVDPVPVVPYKGTTHTSLCKPRSGFTYPVDQLEEVM